MRLLAAALLAVALLTSGDSARSEPENDVANAVKALANDRNLKDAQIGVVVLDAETGALLGETGAHLVMNPASNAKLYTSAAALAILHGTHKYQTTLGGTIKSGAISGPLVLRGHADPSLKTEDLFALAQELDARGVKKVDDVIVDQSFFDDQTTPPAFEQKPNEWAAFRAPISAVALNGNTVTMTVRPQGSGSNALVAFDPPGFVDVDGTVKTSESGADTVGLDLSGKEHRLAARISGAVGADSKIVRYTRRVDDPQLFAGYVLVAVLKKMGIQVAGDVKLGTGKEKAPVFARHESAPLSTLLYSLGKHSDNFVAEMIFKSIASEGKLRPGKSQDAAEVVTKWIDKHELGDQGLVIKNGSGLFDSNHTTAASVGKLLRYAWGDSSMHAEFVAQLAIGGVDGTLHTRFPNDKGHRAISAKTETLDDAIALSGYVLGPPGKHALVFSILINHVTGKQSSARIGADKLVEALLEHQF